jgi:hypothetical protein
MQTGLAQDDGTAVTFQLNPGQSFSTGEVIKLGKAIGRDEIQLYLVEVRLSGLPSGYMIDCDGDARYEKYRDVCVPTPRGAAWNNTVYRSRNVAVKRASVILTAEFPDIDQAALAAILAPAANLRRAST